MAANKAGVIVILSSPSGAGKTTLVKKIAYRKNFKISISHTTRKPRINEIDGVDYFFINNSKFKKLISSGKFLEYARVFKNLYGSSKQILNPQIFMVFDVLCVSQSISTTPHPSTATTTTTTTTEPVVVAHKIFSER